MSVQKITNYDIPTILPTDTGDTALRLMDEHDIKQIPVVADNQYMALLKEDDMLDWDTPEQPVSASDFLRYSPAVSVNGHAYDAIRIAYNQNITVVPVVDNENNYKGAVTLETMMNYVAENSSLDSPGGVMVIEVNPLDYSLVEIARISESEEVSILATTLHNNKATNKLELTIKTNRNNLDALATTYERFGYTVKEVYGEHSNREDMMDRYNLLMAYINM